MVQELGYLKETGASPRSCERPQTLSRLIGSTEAAIYFRHL